MFPSFNFDTETTTEENVVISTELGRVFLMKFNGNKATIVLENGKPKEATTNKEKVEMYVQMLLRTEFEKYKVYKDTGFGMTYFKYRGNKQLPIGFINSELKREIEEKVTALTVVDSISNFSAAIKGTVLQVDFTINLTDNTNLQISEVI